MYLGLVAISNTYAWLQCKFRPPLALMNLFSSLLSLYIVFLLVRALKTAASSSTRATVQQHIVTSTRQSVQDTVWFRH